MKRRIREQMLVATLQAIQRTTDQTADELREWARKGLVYCDYVPETEATTAEIQEEIHPRFIGVSEWI